MKTNEGNFDRVIRIIIGLGIVSLAYLGPQTPWAFIGLVPLVTGLFGFCPVYRLLDISTCASHKKRFY